MKLAVCLALLGFVAVVLAQDEKCPTGFNEKFSEAKKDCKEQLGIKDSPKPEGGKHHGGQAKGPFGVAALMEMKPLMRQIRQIAKSKGPKGEKKAKTDEEMKAMFDCIDEKLKADQFYIAQKNACSDSPKDKDGKPISSQRCVAMNLKKACGGGCSKGKEGPRGHDGASGRQAKQAAPLKAASFGKPTRMAMNNTGFEMTDDDDVDEPTTA